MTDPERVGFFEESQNVKSSTRLFTQELIVLAFVLVLGSLAYGFWGPAEGKATVVGLLMGGLGTAIAGGAVAIYNRNKGD